MYAMLGTRLDLAFTVSTLSKYCINPSPRHAQAVQCVFRYLKKTLDYRITFGGTLNPVVDEATRQEKLLAKGLTGTTVFGFTNSDQAGDKDSRRSTSSYLYTLYNGSISWKSAKQPIVATSSTKAEYIACTEAAKEGLQIRQIIGEIRGESPKEPLHYSYEIDT